MPDLTDVKVGDTLSVVSNDKRWAKEGVHVTVTKVARRWITVDRGWDNKFDRTTGLSDGHGYTPAYEAWHTQEEQEAAESTENAWKELRESVGRAYSVPDGMTVEKIQQARELLGLVTED